MGISTSALTSSLRFCDNKDQQLLALPQIEFSWTLLDLPSILRTGRPLKSIFVEEKVKEKTRYQNIPYPSSPKKIQSRNSNLPLFRLSHPCSQSCITLSHTCTRSTSIPETNKACTFHTNPPNNPIPALHHVVQQLLQRQHGRQTRRPLHSKEQR